MSQGKYQDKRLSATDVTRLYAAGERDFRGAVLRGCNFYGVDLSGADFSGADIRSAVFSHSKLSKANFSKAIGGIRKRLRLTQILIILWLATLSFTFAAVIGDHYLREYTLIEESTQDFIHANLIASVSLIITTFALLRKGFKEKTSIAFTATSFIASKVLIETLGPDIALGNLLVFGFFLVFFIGAPSFVVPQSLALAIISASASLPVFASTQTVGLFFAYFLLVTRQEDLFVGLGDSWGFIALLLFITMSIIFSYIEWEFVFISRLLKAFTSSFGTKFQCANLREANFSYSYIGNVNLSGDLHDKTDLFQTRFYGAKGLAYARLENTNLSDSRVLDLLTTLNGIDQDLRNADLRGANLAGAKLHRANLTSANLSGALLHHAELQGATLTGTNCIAADLTAAQLTGACLEAWNIDSTTILKDIDCQYVFLREQPDDRGDRERRPHDPDKIFQLGDFEKFFREMLDTVQILIRNGVDPQAFRMAFEKVMAEYPSITRDSIQAMEKQGSDVLLTLQVPEGTDKGKLERTWDEGYQLGLKEGYTSGLLERHKQRADDVKEVALSFSRFFSPIHINNMNNPINTGDGSFYAGGDVNLSSSTLNLGQISGQVTNQINQIPAPATPDQPNLRDILTQLKTAVETDSELSDDEKAEALQAVARIAAAGTEPNPDDKAKGIVKRATDALKGMTETLTDASKLADACTKLLPLVLSLFALI